MENEYGVVEHIGPEDDFDQDEYHQTLNALIEDAVDYEESYLARVRNDNMNYYHGNLPGINAEEDTIFGDPSEPNKINKSQFVSTDVRDTILTILPSLVRIFTASEKVAEFVPNHEGEQDLADEQYDYANYVFYEDNPGFLILHSLFKDSLINKAGVVKWWTDNDHEVTEQAFSNVTMEQLQALVYEMPDVEIKDIEQTSPELIDRVVIRHVVSKPLIRVEAVPLEEFRVSRIAKDIKTSPLVGHETVVPLSDVVKKGIDIEDLRDMVTSMDRPGLSMDKQIRNPALATDTAVHDGILYGEWYVRIDRDGDGIDELRRIVTIGDNRVIIEDEVAHSVPFSVFSSDPRPHTLIGDCIADITKDIQRIKTNMMRGQLDNLAEVMNPRTVVNELTTNIEDALNDEVGAIIRTRGDPSASVSFHSVRYVGDKVQESIGYLDGVRASRTGITEASKGLDPAAMQSTALSGINAIISGAQERIELIARILAETGLKDLLKGIVREAVNHPNQGRMIKLRGDWKAVNPSLYDPSMRVKINPTLGKGTDSIRMQLLTKIEQTQLLILERFGIKNPIVTPQEFLNTQEDILKIGNIRNFSRYYRPMTEEVLKSIMEAPDEPSAEMVLAQAELEKVKKDIAVAMSRQATEEGKQEVQRERLLLDQHKAEQADEYKRDKLNIDSMFEAARLFQEGIQALQVPPAVRRENQP